MAKAPKNKSAALSKRREIRGDIRIGNLEKKY
jgi:hypothetical protein